MTLIVLHRWLERLFSRAGARRHGFLGHPVELDPACAPWVLIGAFRDARGQVHEGVYVRGRAPVVFEDPERLWSLAWKLASNVGAARVVASDLEEVSEAPSSGPPGGGYLVVASEHVFWRTTHPTRLLAGERVGCVGLFPRPLGHLVGGPLARIFHAATWGSTMASWPTPDQPE
jgi:hypothetical protein